MWSACARTATYGTAAPPPVENPRCRPLLWTASGPFRAASPNGLRVPRDVSTPQFTLRVGWVLKFPHPGWVPMQTRQSRLEGTGEIRLRPREEALRVWPSRTIVGEVRSHECLDLLLVLNAACRAYAPSTPTVRQRRGGAVPRRVRRHHLGLETRCAPDQGSSADQPVQRVMSRAMR
jgi:hypothetical protein